MSEPYIFEWNGQHLVPESAYDMERCQQFKKGEKLKSDRLTRTRSDKMQRKYWKCLALFVEATECAPTSKHLHNLIKQQTGYTTRIELPGNVYVDIPDSTAFDSMGQSEFNHYVKIADKWCLETFGAPLMTDNEESTARAERRM